MWSIDLYPHQMSSTELVLDPRIVPPGLNRVYCTRRREPKVACCSEGACQGCIKNIENYINNQTEYHKIRMATWFTGFGVDEEVPTNDSPLSDEACSDILRARIAKWIKEKEMIIRAEHIDTIAHGCNNRMIVTLWASR